MSADKQISKCNDQELFLLIRKRNKKAFMVLMQRYSGPLYAYIKSEIMTRTNELVADKYCEKILICIISWLWHHIEEIPENVSLNDCLFTVTDGWLTALYDANEIERKDT